MRFVHYLIPRFVLLGVLCLGLWLSSAILARYSVNRTEATLNHAIGTDEVQVGWNDHSLTLSNVTVGDPAADPMYLEMDKVTLKLDPKAIVSRRLVVRDGVITNLHLIDSRIESHQKNVQDQTASAFSGTAEVVRETLSDKLESAIRAAQPEDLRYHNPLTAGQTWWKTVASALEAEFPSDSTVVDEFKTRWLTKIETCRKQAAELQKQIAEIKTQTNRPTNPLRAHSMTIETQQRLTRLTTELVDVQSELQDIQKKALIELQQSASQAAELARQTQSRLGLPEPDAHLISHQVISNQSVDQIQAMLRWVDWAGNLVPNLTISAEHVRGRDVSFGQPAQSSLQIDKLTLVGVTDVGGDYYRFMGRLNNFSNSPGVQQQPTSLTLRAQGPQHMIVNALYDRRQDDNKIVINVKSPDLVQGETNLPAGLTNDGLGLGFSVSPTTAFSQISLTLDGEKLAGEVVVRHHNALIQLADGQIGDATLAERINYELSACDTYETTYQLEGTVDNLVARPSCDLGNRIATALKSATNEHIAKMVEFQTEQQLAMADQQMKELNGWLETSTKDVYALIQLGRSQIASIQGSIQRIDSQSLRLR